MGHTRIAPHALKRTVEAVAATAFGIAPGQVAVSWTIIKGSSV
ncbi:hypothetical protein [Arthrobacter ulcerisalmonis]